MLLAGGVSFAAEKLTVKDIIELKGLGFTDEELIVEIKKTGEKYELTEAEIKNLKGKNISDKVISVMKGEIDDSTITKPPTSAPAKPYNVASTAAPACPTDTPQQTPEPTPDATTHASPKTDSQSGAMIPTKPIVEPQQKPLPEEAFSPPAKIPQELVGFWQAEVRDMYGNTVARFQLQYWPNGQYSSYTVANTVMGIQETTNSGMVSVVGNMISGSNQLGQNFSYGFQLQSGGNQLVINMPEWGGNVVFSRQQQTEGQS